ncbi:MAG: nucleotide exchange factor GrpE [Saprospiraceae bacterium]|nr:nucleotide exchange factor GrpE [Saprospiraceae bacterium]
MTEDIIPNDLAETEANEINLQETADNLDEKQDGESQISRLKVELDESKDKYLRLFAEFDNYKKRNMKERLELIRTAAQETLQALIPVVDDFERAKKASEMPEATEKFPEGVNLVYHKFLQILEAKGLKGMTSNGEVFDAEKHEAITEIPAPTPDMVGKVVDTVEKGYYLHDKIIRYAKVVVGK